MRSASTGMYAERLRMDVISGNVANANSVNRAGRPQVQRQVVILKPTDSGVKIDRIVADKAPARTEYQPGHPDADDKGMVTYTNINPVFEMIDMVGASRAYEANLAAFNTAKSMLNSALTIGRSA